VAATLSHHEARHAHPVKAVFTPSVLPRKRNRAAKQEALLQAALRLFAVKGYESTTTREIAATAGCAEGLIHRYFQGKAGLLAALVDYRVAREVGDLRHKVHPASTLQQEFLQLVNWEVERMWQDRDFLRVLIPRAIVDPEVAVMMGRSVTSVRAKVVLERLKQFHACARLPEDELTALAQSVGVIGIVFGFLRPLILGHDRLRAKEMAGVLAKILIRGVVTSRPDQVS